MKRICMIFLLCFVLIGCQSKKIESSVNIITLDEFEERYKNKENFILIIGRDDCPNCISLLELIEYTNIEYEYNILYLKYSSENKEEFLGKVENYFENIEMIPYYAIIVEGQIEKTGQGYSEAEDFLTFIDVEIIK